MAISKIIISLDTFVGAFQQLLKNSIVGFTIVSTLKKRQLNKRLLSQLDESDADFMKEQGKHGSQFEIRKNMTDENVTLKEAIHSAPVNGSQVDLHTLQRNNTNRVRGGVENVMATVEIRVREKTLNAIECLIIPRL